MRLLTFKAYQKINIALFFIVSIFGAFLLDENFRKISLLVLSLLIILNFVAVREAQLLKKISILPKRIFFILMFGMMILFSFQAYMLGFADNYPMLVITIISPLISFMSLLFTKID